MKMSFQYVDAVKTAIVIYKCRFCVWTDAINLVEMANVIIAEFRDT